MAALTSIALGVAVAATVGSIGMSVAQSRQQKKATKKQEQQQRTAANRERRQAIRQSRIERARSLNAAAQIGGGAEGSSGIAGGLTSLNSQTGSNIGFGTQMSALSSDINKASSKAATFGNLGSIFGSVGSLAFSGYQALNAGAFGYGQTTNPTAAQGLQTAPQAAAP